MFAFAPMRPRRRPSLTPMIDVVFLLLVFFMLAARFGQEVALPLATSGPGADYAGPPRLIDVTAGSLSLNGMPVELEALGIALAPLMSDPSDPLLLRAGDGADVQRLVLVLDALRAQGLSHVILVDAR